MSTKSVAQKLLVKAGNSLWLSHPDRLYRLGPLPEGVTLAGTPDVSDVAVLFVDDAASARDLLAEFAPELSRPRAVWTLYPKGNRTDVNRDSLWPMVAEHGLRPVSQVAVDEVWSALRFRPLRDGEQQFGGGR